MVSTLTTSTHQDILDKLAEVANHIHALHDRPGINLVKTSALVVSTPQQLALETRTVCTGHLLSLWQTTLYFFRDLIVLQNTERTSVIIIGHAETMPKNVNQATNTPSLTVLPRKKIPQVLTSALFLVLQKNAFFNPSTNTHFTHFHTLTSPICTIKGQDLNITESIELNCQQSSMTVSPVKELNKELFPTETRELSKEFSHLADD
nr:hypothetical protein HmN_000153900 [Hymenolepis microstoma]